MDINICRICLDKKAIIYIFSKENDDISYSSKIMRCVNVNLSESDDFPKMICELCAQELSVAFRFVEKCESSDRALRTLQDHSNFAEPLLGDLQLDYNIKPDPDNLDNYDDLFEFKSGPDIDIPLLEDEQPIKVEKEKPKKKIKRGKTGPVRCVICGHITVCRSAMETHMRSHTGEKPFSCNHCHMKFATRGGLKRHIVNNHSERERRFTCETCGNSFFTKSDIITHMRIHTDEKPYTCPHCAKCFRQIASLIRHKRIHTGEKPFACPVCGKCFADRNLVRKHQHVHSNERNFVCHICSKSVKTRTALNTHMRLHSNQKQNVCSFCGMAFSMKGNLKAHMIRMHSEKSGECTICAKTFPDLEEHMRKHTGERPYVCASCGRNYATKRSLSHHTMFKHQNAAKFKCSVGECIRCFPTAVMLEYHILKQHTSHTPYICPHCSRGFYRNSDLSRHLKVTHLDVQLKMTVKTLIE